LGDNDLDNDSFKSISNNLTVTEKLFLKNMSQKFDFFDKFFTNPQLQEIFNLVIAFEKEYQQDHVLLFHGQRFAYLLPEQLFTDLMAMHEGKDRPTDFMYAHIKPFKKELGSPEQQEKHRAKLREKGCFQFPEEKGRQCVLFTQPSPFEGERGTTPATYFVRNCNVQEVKAQIKETFEHAGYAPLYKKYGPKLEAHQQKMQALTEHGNMLCIAVPKKLASDYCFPSASGGPLQTREIGDQKTDNVPTIYDEYKKGSFTNTHDGSIVMIMLSKALDPESGIKVIPLYTFKDKDEWIKLGLEYKEIIEQIKEDTEKARSGWFSFLSRK